MTLTDLLKREGFTQREFGERLGVVQTAVSNWCNGANRPSISKIREMAKVLGVSLEELLSAIEEPQKKEDVREVSYALIARFRKERHYTQEYLAKLLGVGQSTVACWETGRSIPSMKNIIALAELFGVTVDDICACLKG